MADQQSLHDSLTDTHQLTQSSSAAQQLENQAPITTQEPTDVLQEAEHDDASYSTDDSDSTSLHSSLRDYIYQYGRRYHAYRADRYSFPNDEREQDCEDLKHATFLKLFNNTLHFAPLPPSGSLNVIDLGTGTGIWAMDFADRYPEASVLGTDLSPIQSCWVPPNVKFFVDDAESEWPNEPNFFDYIHTRHTIQAFHDWPTLFSRAYYHLKPGGWIECQELDHFPRSGDGTLAPDNPMATYWKLVADGLATLGVKFRLAPNLASLMRAAGLVNVTERRFFVPIGPWPKKRTLRQVGQYWRHVLTESLEAIALGPLIKGLGWGKEEVDVFLAGVRKAYLEKGTHAYMPFYAIYGQKPPASQVPTDGSMAAVPPVVSGPLDDAAVPEGYEIPFSVQ